MNNVLLMPDVRSKNSGICVYYYSNGTYFWVRPMDIGSFENYSLLEETGIPETSNPLIQLSLKDIEIFKDRPGKYKLLLELHKKSKEYFYSEVLSE